ncbi:3 beta-hydroxysteroid dehydrogenase/Delta 5--_4-isomerase [Maioricimonas rarisocia]|uniref:3 beta-hydroxysteroid dehydrogenase/Delta 5-->4-isomerase n=1 Tax=Maioricimonas rarisocia TaxID=2528026 RepID=A0A517Z7D1_9PLAN|nr:NAD-dependent epimerase/dehydratase family protein [Maioricimonas rarisocia]QDU38375.1 3 beta-hydroxysteroid dehydrogenase/Delta 5-->4-isomerase [Maioricimonas rarisocia]
MSWSDDDLLLVTGATGLVGSHVAERARKQGIRTRALARSTADIRLLQKWDVEIATGSLTEPYAIKGAMQGATHVVHCAAKVGDWGPVEKYREVNVGGLESLLEAAGENDRLKRFVHISSLGVYPARDHYGTDESVSPNKEGIDGYTLTKVESEELFLEYVRRNNLPGLALRPGFVYGPRDRTVLPRIIERLRDGKFAYLGSGEQLMNNTFVENLVDAVFLALERDDLVGEVFNITDGRLVSKQEFIESIADSAGLRKPTKHVPLGVAKVLATVMETAWRTLGKDEAPLLSQARIKFLGLNLDYSIEKAKRELNYQPKVDFRDGMQRTMEWFREQGVA